MKPEERVAALLRARRWALAVLGDAQPMATPEIPHDVWARFFSYERCAAVLLASAKDAARIPSEALETIRSVAATESQSSLRARAEGRVLSDIASRLDFPVVVLKGGVRAVAGLPPTLPLTDVDILVDRSRVDSVTALLHDGGFGEPAPPTRHHQGITPAADRLTVEVHWTTNDDGTPLERGVWDRIRTIPGVPALKQLGAADNLEYILRHAVSSHCDRSVALRDVILAGVSALECDAAEIELVRARILSGRHATQLEQMLELAIELAAPSGLSPKDPFEAETAAFFATTVAEVDSGKRVASPSALAFITEIAVGRTSLFEAPARAYVFRGTANATLSRLSARHPRLVNPVIGVGHVGYYAMTAALLLPRIRRIATRALRQIGPQTA